MLVDFGYVYPGQGSYFLHNVEVTYRKIVFMSLDF